MTDLNRIAKAFRLFNEKAEKLSRLSFVEKMNDPNNGISISWKREEDGSTSSTQERRGPEEEAIDAFVLTFRFFIQDNEQSSFHNMEKHYLAAPIDQSLKDEFLDLRQRINDYLDDPSLVNIRNNDEDLTRRRIMDVCVYGGLAHGRNEDKRRLYKTWMMIPMFRPMIEHVFVSTLADIHEAIAGIRKINLKALQCLPGPS